MVIIYCAAAQSTQCEPNIQTHMKKKEALKLKMKTSNSKKNSRNNGNIKLKCEAEIWRARHQPHKTCAFFFRWRIFIYSLFKSWYCQLNFNVRSDLFSYNYVCFFSLFSLLSCGIMVLFIYLCEHIFFSAVWFQLK